MANKHKIVLVPMDKVGYSLNDIVKCIELTTLRKPVGSIQIAGWECTDPIKYWQPQQLLIVSDGDLSAKGLCYSAEGGIGVWNEEYFGKNDDTFGNKMIIAAYPQIEGIPTIELSDIQEIERRGWPETVEVKVEPLTTEMKSVDSILMLDRHPIYVHKVVNSSIVINWEPAPSLCDLFPKPTVSNSKIVVGEVMDSSSWLFANQHERDTLCTWQLMNRYAEYYHQQKTKWIKISDVHPVVGRFYLFTPPKSDWVLTGQYMGVERNHHTFFLLNNTFIGEFYMSRPDAPKDNQSDVDERSVASAV